LVSTFFSCCVCVCLGSCDFAKLTYYPGWFLFCFILKILWNFFLHSHSHYSFFFSQFMYLFIHLFFVSTRVWIQGLSLFKQAFYHLSHSSGCSFVGYFWCRISHLFAGALLSYYPLDLHLLRERITVMSHWDWAINFFRCIFLALLQGLELLILCCLVSDLKVKAFCLSPSPLMLTIR
jgi:hypothetical protein